MYYDSVYLIYPSIKIIIIGIIIRSSNKNDNSIILSMTVISHGSQAY